MAAKFEQDALRVVEFYSGIGGMHYALKECGIRAEVVAAIDINTTANQVYKHNFSDTLLLNRNIEGMKLNDFVQLNADVFTMSPPCQPFTRQGLQKASGDARTKSFYYIMDLIRRLPKRPTYILMENVKGFEISDTRQDFVETLNEANYSYQEFLLSPGQFGIPNSRLRYFLIAVLKPRQFSFKSTQTIMDCLPRDDNKVTTPIRYNPDVTTPRLNCTVCSPTQHSSVTTTTHEFSLDGSNTHRRTEADMQTRKIKDFLVGDAPNESNSDEFLLPNHILKSKVLLMDLVQAACNHSCCFTKGYGHYIEGSGSVLQQGAMDTLSSDQLFSQYNECTDEEERSKILQPLRLRYFTPREIANLLHFPNTFVFPDSITTKQRYRLLGNSLNVLVVTKLMDVLFETNMRVNNEITED